MNPHHLSSLQNGMPMNEEIRLRCYRSCDERRGGEEEERRGRGGEEVERTYMNMNPLHLLPAERNEGMNEMRKFDSAGAHRSWRS